MKLSEAIRLGSTTVTEDKCWFYKSFNPTEDCYGCALGTAWYAATDGKQEWNEYGVVLDEVDDYGNSRFLPKVIIEAFSEYPTEFLIKVSDLHFWKMKTRLELANLVEKWEEENLPKEEKAVEEAVETVVVATTR